MLVESTLPSPLALSLRVAPEGRGPERGATAPRSGGLPEGDRTRSEGTPNNLSDSVLIPIYTQDLTSSQSTTDTPRELATKLRQATQFKRNDNLLFVVPAKHISPMFEGNGSIDAKGNIVVLVVGPFGGGKNSLVDSAIKVAGNCVQQVVEHTSRAKRSHETEGKEYFFVTRDEFLRMAENDEILVWGDLTNNFYGYSINAIQDALNTGKVPILVQGPHNVGPLKSALEKRNIPTIVAFVSPLSKEELSKEGGVDKAVKILEDRMEGTERNRLEDRLEISKAMFESLPKGIPIIDNSNGRIDQATIDFLSLIQAKKGEISKPKLTKHPAMTEFEETGQISDDFFNRHKLDPKGRKVIIISGPSGVGKGTIINAAQKKDSVNFVKLPSSTSRAPRPNEVDGIDYNFITREQFEEKIRTNKLLEWLVVVNGNYYGQSQENIQSVFDEGKDIVMDLDIHGTNYFKYILKRFGVPVIDVFISPVSKEILYGENGIENAKAILRERIVNRKSGETREQIDDRVNMAAEYLQAANTFTHFIDNSDGNLGEATCEFIDILKQL